MPLTTYTLTGTLSDLIGTAFDSASIRGKVVCANPAVLDPNTKIRLGPDYPLTISAGGSFTRAGLPGGEVYKVVIAYKEDVPQAGQKSWSSQWFQLDADADISDPALDAVAPVTISTDYLANLEQAIADAQAVLAALPASTAAAVTYDNVASGLTADDVQAAIDEVAAGGGGGSGTVTGVNGQTPVSGEVTIVAADIAALDDEDAASTVQGELDRLQTEKSDSSHSHTSVIALSRAPKGMEFNVYWRTDHWEDIDGNTITARPSARTDIAMKAVGGTTPPSFAIDDIDVHLAQGA